MSRTPSETLAVRGRSVGLAFAGVGAIVLALGLVIADGYRLLLTGAAFELVGLAVAVWSVMRG